MGGKCLISLMRRLLAVVVMGCLSAQGQTILDTLSLVDVQNAGNSASASGYGAVGYNFKINRYEITSSQYAVFLNAVAQTDSYSLYNSYMGSGDPIWGAGKSILRSGSSGSYSYSVVAGREYNPVSFVTMFSAMRFANWLSNGGVLGASTETGAYSLNGATSGYNWIRASNANFWIPSIDEFVKAAFYNPSAGNYFSYGTGSNSQPLTSQARYNNGNSPTSGIGNDSSAVGYYGITSPYGLFDVAGNLAEWSDTRIGLNRDGGAFYLLGGSIDSGGGGLAITSVGTSWNSPNSDPNMFTGFRIAGVPEPSSLSLLLAGGTLLTGWC